MALLASHNWDFIRNIAWVSNLVFISMYMYIVQLCIHCKCTINSVKYTGLIAVGCVGLLGLCDLWQIVGDLAVDKV